jgi:DNA end-binding protein Ku
VDEFRTDVTLVKEKEVELARMLVESLAATFEPEKYHDTYRDNLQSMIDAKIKGKEVVTPPSREPAKIIDIMEALKQSLASRKPAASTADVSGAAEADSKPKKRTARGKS